MIHVINVLILEKGGKVSDPRGSQAGVFVYFLYLCGK